MSGHCDRCGNTICICDAEPGVVEWSVWNVTMRQPNMSPAGYTRVLAPTAMEAGRIAAAAQPELVVTEIALYGDLTKVLVERLP